jgi:hypothetical protein
MPSADFDENGWARGAIALLATSEAWTLLSPEPDARVDAARWAHQAIVHFGALFRVVQDKRYPAATMPLADRAHIDVTPRGAASATRVRVVTVPVDRAPEALAAARAGARAIGGAGFDAILPRTRRVWQAAERLVAPVPGEAEGADARAPLLVAAVIASVLLAPIVPPEGGTIFGVKGARERLAARGLPA